MEKLVCDKCGREYTGQADIDSAKRDKGEWEAMVRRDGEEPRGLCPCPNVMCSGELKLVEVTASGRLDPPGPNLQNIKYVK